MITTSNLQFRISVPTSAQEAFSHINDVTKWWTENLEGDSHKLNDEFSVRFADIHYSKQRLVEFIPGQRVVWLVTDSRLNFLKDKEEWTGTRISFDLLPEDGKTVIIFTHEGLTPDVECFGACSNAWQEYVQSLQSLITTSKGNPAKKEA